MVDKLRRDSFGGIRYDITILGFILLTIMGIMLDIWAHYTGRVSNEEGFLTLWHLILYTGGGLIILMLALPAWTGMRAGKTLEESMPAGYLWAFYSIPIFGIGGLADAAWHTAFGVEVGTDAVVSPSHLILLIGMLGLLSAPFQAMCMRYRPGERLTWRRDWPGLISLGTVYFLINAVFYYANSLLINLRWYNPEFALSMGITFKPETAQFILENEYAAYQNFSLIPAATSTIVTTFLLLFLLMRVGKRFVLPIGFWVVMFAFSATHAFMYRQANMFLVALILGIVVELVLMVIDYQKSDTRLRLASFFLPFTFHLGLAIVSLGNTWWSPHGTWGLPLYAGVVGALIGLVAYKPPEWLRSADDFSSNSTEDIVTQESVD